MADISYTRTTWADGAEGGTAIDATKLNNIEQGIVDAVAAIGPNDTTEDGTLKAQIDENTSDIETLQESVSLSVSYAPGMNVYFDAGEGQQHFTIWVTVINAGSSRYGHRLALIVNNGGVGCWDGTTHENVF